MEVRRRRSWLILQVDGGQAPALTWKNIYNGLQSRCHYWSERDTTEGPSRRGGLALRHEFCVCAPCQASRAGRGEYPERDQPGDCAASKQQLAGLDMKNFSCGSTE